MNSQIKQKWIDALKSGEYQQTSNNLRTEQGYCCLGVLCDLYAKEKSDDDVRWSQYYDEYVFLGEDSILPGEVREWAGLSDNDVFYTDDGEGVYLAYLNDSGTNFEQLAQIIEENI